MARQILILTVPGSGIVRLIGHWFQEAMAMGLPIITTDSVGCRDTIEDGVNGFLVPVRDPEALAKTMTRFLKNPDLIATMGQAGRRTAEKRFDVHNINCQIINTLSRQ